ncbi:hypothetical protein [Phytohabitans houttuyneae]|uniref:TauD/TfdA-like domain-containing protein n=1 Tax=Phytohabitans houttuyneae TaxID=1076126 RepID=A0A6V8KNY7_9ACTN|nr:hypothetical protein [Phytohabitans houttuyneae]GFJ83899.1 hypothetical protein Phou_080790 [Phytohabitans houttuyneae]
MAEWIDYRTANPARFDRDVITPIPAASIVPISAVEHTSLLESAMTIPACPYIPEQREDFIAAAREASRKILSSATRSAATAVLDSGPGALLLEHLPVDPGEPPSPAAGGSLDPGHKSTFVSEFVCVALSVLVDAEIFNFRQEGRGSAPLFDNVVPIESMRLQRGAGGFANNFPFHCDSTWHRMRPDYLALIGVRAAPQAWTLSCSVVDLVQTETARRMPLESFRLKPPQLYTQMAEQGIPLGTPEWRMMDPVDAAATELNVNFNGTDCADPAAVEWLAELEELVEARATGCLLGPGNALLLNNRRVCHTRTGYTPTFGAQARWFVRANFKRALWDQLPADDHHAAPVMRKNGWLDDAGRLTEAFLPFVENPARVAGLTGEAKEVAAQALHYTPVPRSRLV